MRADAEPGSTQLSQLTFALGASLLALPALTLVLAAAGLWLGLPVSGLPAAIAFAAVAAGFISQTRGSTAVQRWAGVAAFAAVVAGCAFVSGRIYDLSWDGQAYHQEAIIQLMRGWNPFRETSLPFRLQGDGYNMWVDHYPKGWWLCAASVGKLLGGIEYGKAFTPMVCVGSGLLAFSVLHTCSLGVLSAILFAGLMALGPVVFSQLSSFYVDGPMASLILGTLALLYHAHRRPGPPALRPLAGCIVLMVNLKFTGAANACIAAALLALYFVVTLGLDPRKWPRPPRVVLATLCGAVVVGVLLVGYQPYVVNTLTHGHPFYPVMGRGGVDVIDRQINPEFAAMNQIAKAFYSMFARTENNLQAFPTLKVPFGLQKWEIDTMAAVDPRIGGFGPWFGPIAVGSLMLLGWSLATSRRAAGAAGHRALLVGLAIAVVTGLANPEAWWARFSPQLWLVAPLSLAVVLAYSVNRWHRAVAWVLTVLLAANLAMTVWAVTSSNVPANRMLHEQLRNLASYTRDHGPVVAVFGYFPSNRVRLTEAGVKWRHERDAQPANTAQLVRSDTAVLMY